MIILRALMDVNPYWVYLMYAIMVGGLIIAALITMWRCCKGISYRIVTALIAICAIDFWVYVISGIIKELPV